MILVRYGELFLKSESVRRHWQKLLCHNIRVGLPSTEIISQRGRIFVDAALDKAQPVLEKIFGIYSFSDVVECTNDIDTIKHAALPLLNKGTFAVRTNRADKRYPMTSQEVSREVGAFLVEKTGQKVNLSNPDAEVFIELFDGKAFLFNKKLPGPGGLPLGTSKRLLLENNSEDAVLAGWLMMKRGCTLNVVGNESPELERWSIGRKIHYVDGGDYLAVVSGSTDLSKLREGTVFYPLLGLPDATVKQIRQKVFNT